MQQSGQHPGENIESHSPDSLSADPGAGAEILSAFDHACDEDALELATLLLIELERIVTRSPISLRHGRRREMEVLISAHRRLWNLLGAGLERASPDEVP